MAASITVITPTFNRAHTLPRAYHALCAQTSLPHEWIIIDDGSADGTRELVQGWVEAAPFPIHYAWQNNAGKPSAHNRGVSLATGELVSVLDSDDWCEPNALERFGAVWEEIPEAEREHFTGVAVHRADEHGQLIGRLFPASPMDSTLSEMVDRGWCVGDKWGFHRRDVLAQYPFPVFPGETFVPEGVVWNRIGRHFRMRFVNETLGRTEYQPDGLSSRRLASILASPRGFHLFYSELAPETRSMVRRAHAYANVMRFALHARRSGEMPRVKLRGASGAVGLLAGCGMWAGDLLRDRVQSRRPTAPRNSHGQ